MSFCGAVHVNCIVRQCYRVYRPNTLFTLWRSSNTLS